MTIAQPEKILVTYLEAGRITSLSPRTIWALVARREIPAIRCGRAVRISVDDLRAWIERKKGGAE
jgi:excisionase family DNA binding protein